MWVEDKPQCDWSNQSYAKVSLENTTGLRNKWEETGEAWEGPRGRTGLQGAKAIKSVPLAAGAASFIKVSRHFL